MSNTTKQSRPNWTVWDLWGMFLCGVTVGNAICWEIMRHAIQ